MLNRYLPALFALSAVTLAGCGGIEGRYVMVVDGVDEENVPGISLELRGGDVAVVTLPGLGSTEGTYSVEGDTVTVRMEDGDLDEFRIVDGNLVASGFGEEMVFEKQ